MRGETSREALQFDVALIGVRLIQVQLLVTIYAEESMVLGKVVTYPRLSGRGVAVEPHETPWHAPPVE